MTNSQNNHKLNLDMFKKIILKLIKKQKTYYFCNYYITKLNYW